MQIHVWNSNVFRAGKVERGLRPNDAEPRLAVSRTIPRSGSATDTPRCRKKRKVHARTGARMADLPCQSTSGRRMPLSEDTALLVRQPDSSLDTLRTKCVYVLSVVKDDREPFGPDWFYDGIPARLGHAHCVDLASIALMISSQYEMRWPGVTLTACLTALHQALGTLREHMARRAHCREVDDATLQTVALLAPFEANKGEHNLLIPAHIDGLVTFLTGRAQPWGETSRQIMDYFCCDMMVYSVVKGTASPLETLSVWRAPQNSNFLDTNSRLRAVRVELCIRLPRLVALVRATREETSKGELCSPVAAHALFEQAIVAAQAVLDVRDEQAEREAMQSLKIISTSNPRIASFNTRSYVFQDAQHWDSLAAYWQTRTCALRLSCALAYIATSKTAATAALLEAYTQSGISPAAKTEMQLVITSRHLLRSAQFASTLRRTKRQRVHAQGLIHLWGACRDLARAIVDDAVDIPHAARLKTLRDFLLDATTMSLKIPRDFIGDSDMDDAAELFVGGPIRGAYARLYGWTGRREHQRDEPPSSTGRCFPY
jgi:hypothetical protein